MGKFTRRTINSFKNIQISNHFDGLEDNNTSEETMRLKMTKNSNSLKILAH